MDLLIKLLDVSAPVFLVMAAGYLWGKSRHRFDQVFVTQVVTLVGSPCLIFSALIKIPPQSGPFLQMGLATLACLICFAVISMAGLWLCRLPIKVYLPSLALPNVGNMGLPICLFAFGEDGLALSTIYYAVTTICQFTLGPAIAAGEFKPGLLLKVPFLYAVLLVAFLDVSGWHAPVWLLNTASLGSGLTIPLMLLAMGAAIGQLQVRNFRRAFGVSAARLLIGFVGGTIIANCFGLAGMSRGVLIIQSTMPVAMFNYLFARLYNNEPEEVAGIVVLSTILSYLTLPALVASVSLP